MTTNGATMNSSTAPSPSARREWVRPTVAELPKLTDLTLASPIGGGGGIGGSTVFEPDAPRLRHHRALHPPVPPLPS